MARSGCASWTMVGCSINAKPYAGLTIGKRPGVPIQVRDLHNSRSVKFVKGAIVAGKLIVHFEDKPVMVML
jgi:hypothetical protein